MFASTASVNAHMSEGPFRTIAIIGTGLIGGSLALAWKKHAPDVSLVGFDRADVLDRAMKEGIVSRAARDAGDAVAGADLVVLATPLSAMPGLLSEIAGALDPRVVVTDVGSVKGPIARFAREFLREDVLFVPGHPMSGSEQSGLDAANPYLFENATYVLCPPDEFSCPEHERRYLDLVELVRVTGARVLPMSEDRHDRIAAYVSHLPQLLAVMLTGLVGAENDRDDAALKLAAGGFRDMTRIAASSFGVWEDIIRLNEDAVLDALASVAASVQSVRNRIIENDFAALRGSFDDARLVRDSIPRDSKGFLEPIADVYVHANDRPGWIAEATRVLYEADLNIKDMELLKVREGTGGTFRLSFSDPEAAASAVTVLSGSGFEAYRLSS